MVVRGGAVREDCAVAAVVRGARGGARGGSRAGQPCDRGVCVCRACVCGVRGFDFPGCFLC